MMTHYGFFGPQKESALSIIDWGILPTSSYRESRLACSESLRYPHSRAVPGQMLCFLLFSISIGQFADKVRHISYFCPGLPAEAIPRRWASAICAPTERDDRRIRSARENLSTKEKSFVASNFSFASRRASIYTCKSRNVFT